jgi:prepilin signal peptidase PulO-like enzyme (type II secretory pathway)
VFIALIFLFGLFFGSFLNVVINRLHTGEQFLKGRSHCPHCRHDLSSADLIPVISYLTLRGQCRYCHKHISPQYPLVEFATGIALAIAAAALGWGVPFLFAALATLFLVVLFVFDLKHHLILDVVSYPFAVLALIAGFLFGHTYLDILIGGVIGGGFFLAQILFSRGRWVGGGDAKLGIGMGFLLGWDGVLLALFLAYISGAIIGSILLLSRKATPRSAIPFGTFLTLATYIAMLWADPILLFYDHLV